MKRSKQRGFLEWAVPLGASIISGLFGKSGQDSANETNMALGREQMAFQERMSNTSYQRAVKDMGTAGLNPMLAYSQGGASAPMGSMPQVQNAASVGVSSAAQGASMVGAIQNILQSAAQTEQMKAQTDKIRSETFDIDVNSAYRYGEVRRIEEEEREIAARRRVREGEAISAHADSARKEAELEWMSRDGGAGFAADVRRRKAEASLSELEIPKSKAEAAFFESLGQANPYIRQLLMLLRGGSSVRQIFRSGGSSVRPIVRK